MKKVLLVFVPVFLVVFASGCNYDPSPVGCRFQLESVAPFSIAEVRLNDYGMDSLWIGDKDTIFAALEAGSCPVEFVLNTTVQNMEAQGTVYIEQFDCMVSISAGDKKYLVDSGGIGWRVGVDAPQTGIVCVLLSFDAVEVWGDDLTDAEIFNLCMDLGFNSNGGVRDNQHLGRVQAEVSIQEATPHGNISVQSALIGLDWVFPD
jgi:hypothetical protein